MMELVDTHCHIQSIGASNGESSTRQLWAKASDLTLTKVIDEAQKHGITKLICVGCDLPDSKLAINCAQQQNGAFASIGIHPHEAKDYANFSSKKKEFAGLVKKSKVVAIGECGLDFYYSHSPKEDQMKLLKFQIELALEHNLPLIFHVREAFDDFWPIFDCYKGIKGVLHSFTDNEANLELALQKGLYIGVNGIATFAKSDEQKAVYRNIPLENLVLETDSPYLTPTPYRGTINEPKRVGVIADFLAELRSEKRQDLAKITTLNATKLFGL